MIKVALIIDEYFGGWDTAYGGYGFLARNLIAKYLPNDDIQIEVLLNRRGHRFLPKKKVVDGITLYKLPRNDFFAQKWLYRKNYDIYLSIELTSHNILSLEQRPEKKLILWIQDPRPKSSWDNTISKMTVIEEHCFYNQKIYDLVNSWYKSGRVIFISQGYSLCGYAKELYQLADDTPIQFLPNPINIDINYEFSLRKKTNSVVLLGRLESQKRAWLFCEIAKRMPDIEFYVLGQLYRYKEENAKLLTPYMDGIVPNLHFVGHDDGELKKKYLREAKLLITTAIWEGIPISWLEALSYGTLIVSCINREDLPIKFGKFVGTIPGDGYDDIDKYIPAIRELIEDTAQFEEKAKAAIAYTRETHNIQRFQRDLRNVILANIESPVRK